MKTRCCRDTPRCADCPVLLAAARRRRHGSDVAVLVGEVLGGRPAPQLPACVLAALDGLEAARAQPAARAAGPPRPQPRW